jgi:hypothetical protein
MCVAAAFLSRPIKPVIPTIHGQSTILHYPKNTGPILPVSVGRNQYNNLNHLGIQHPHHIFHISRSPLDYGLSSSFQTFSKCKCLLSTWKVNLTLSPLLIPNSFAK